MSLQTINKEKSKKPYKGLNIFLAIVAVFVTLFVSVVFGLILFFLGLIVMVILDQSAKGTQQVKVRCKNCGTLNEEDADYCKKCAKKL